MTRDERRDRNIEKIKQVEEYIQDGMTAPEAAAKAGFGKNVGYFYQLRKRYGINPVQDTRKIVPVHTNGNGAELKTLRIENQRLRMIVADQCLDIQALKEYAGRK